MGEISVTKLLKKFKTINKIKSLSKEQLILFIGEKKGNLVFNYFNN